MKLMLSFILGITVLLSSFSSEASSFNSCQKSLFSVFQKNLPSQNDSIGRFKDYLPKPDDVEKQFIIAAEKNGFIRDPQIVKVFSGKLGPLDTNKILEAAKLSAASSDIHQFKTSIDQYNKFAWSFSEIIKHNDGMSEIDISIQNFGEQGVQRIHAMLAEYLYRTAEYLIRNNILFLFEADGSIYLAAAEGHYINELAKRLHIMKGASILIDPISLIKTSTGAFVSQRIMFMSPELLLKPSIFKDETAFHEYIHFFDSRGKTAGYTQYIGIKSSSYSHSLGIYKKGFSVDEIKAYRGSIIALIHETLMNPNSGETLDRNYDRVLDRVRLIMNLAVVTKDVMAQALLEFKDMAPGGRGLPMSEIIKSELRTSHGVYEILNLDYERMTSAYELSNFAFRLFMLLEIRMNKDGSRSNEEKIKTLKRIKNVLSIPEIRKMNGNYPTVDTVLRVLNQN